MNKLILISLLFLLFIYFLKKLIQESKKNFENEKVSIIISINNIENYLNDCINSLLNQTYKDIEIILINNCSSNNSLFILNRYAKIDKRIVLIQSDNKKSKNFSSIYYGNKFAKGKYVLFLENNKFYSRNMIYDIFNEAEKSKAEILMYRLDEKNDRKEDINNLYKSVLFNYSLNSISFEPFIWNKLFLRSFIISINVLYDIKKQNNNDFFFVGTSMLISKKIYFYNKIFLYHNLDDKNQNEDLYDSFNQLEIYSSLLEIKKKLEKMKLYFQLKENFINFVKQSYLYYIEKNSKTSILIFDELNQRLNSLGIDTIQSNSINEDFHKRYIKHLNDLIFKHVNLAKEKHEVNIIKNNNCSFKPKVSIIIPIYNMEKNIIECLESILNQKLKEIEIICVIDGSTDNSLFLVEKYANKDNRIKIISQINRGLSEARNTGVKFSKGEYIYFIDADDYLDENALFELYSRGAKDNLDIVYFQGNIILDDSITGEVRKNFDVNYMNRSYNYSEIYKGPDLFYKMRVNNDYKCVSVLQLTKREYYEKIGLSFYPGIVHEDNLFTLTSILFSERCGYVHKSFYNYRIHSNSIIRNLNYMKSIYGYLISYCEIQKILEKKQNLQKKIKENVIGEIENYSYQIMIFSKYITEEQKNILFEKLTVYQEIQYINVINKYK